MNNDESHASWVLLLVPLAVLAGYGWLITDYYSSHLDWNLTYRRPLIGVAHEDVLGMGFLVPWILASVIFLFSLLSVLPAARKPVRVTVIFLILYGTLSALDFFLYQTLEQQVLA